MIPQAILAFAVLFSVAVCGAPFVLRLAPRARWLTRMCLSFSLGFALIMLAGVLSVFLGVSPLLLEGTVALLGIALFLRDRKRILGIGEIITSSSGEADEAKRLDGADRLALAMAALYLFLCIIYFDRIIIWMGGDSLAHAEIIRMLMDGRPVPVGIPPLGSYWEYYPKGFHLFALPWALTFGLLDALRTVPILITAVVPLLIYCMLREMGRKEEAVYAAVLAEFVFSAHYSHLIWAGYPTATAEMLLAAAMLAAVVRVGGGADERAGGRLHLRKEAIVLLAVLLLGVLFAHGRLLVLAVAALLFWQIGEILASGRLSGLLASRRAGAGVAILILMAAAGLAAFGHSPQFLLSVLSSHSLAADYAARWYPAFLSLFGAAIALVRRDRMDRLALAWAGALVLVVLLADTGPLSAVGTADRLLLGLYLPLSILGAAALAAMAEGCKREMATHGCASAPTQKSKLPLVRAAFVLVLLGSGLLGMGAVFASFAGSWAMPAEDYQAIQWLGAQNYSDALCINLDETGAWVYPLTGIEVSNARISEASKPLSDWSLPQKIIADPSSLESIEALNSSGYSRTLVYVSSISITRPGHVPPFSQYPQIFPAVNRSFLGSRYKEIYFKGAYIYGFPGNSFP